MGDPKKAIVKLSGPMIVAMFLMSTYNIVNAIWVAGLGSDALAAVGFVTPLFMILIGTQQRARCRCGLRHLPPHRCKGQDRC